MNRRDRNLDAELKNHLDEAVRDRMDRGQSRADAEAAARREFGNLLLVKEVTREMWGWASLERLGQDLRYGLRMLAKSPAFTVVAVLTLALGIGANTALFSIVNGVLLTPPPFPHYLRLVALYESKPNFAEGSFSYPNYLDLKRDNRTFEAMGVYRRANFTLTGSGDAERLRGDMVSAEIFQMLGVRPALGRIFTVEEDDLGKAPVAMISEGIWKRKFGGSPSIIGRSVTLNGTGRTIVGIVPADFRLAIWNFREGDVYIPIGQFEEPHFRDRNAAWGMNGLGLMKSGVTLHQANADLNRITADLAVAYPESCRGIGATLVPLRERMVGDIAPYLFVLLAAVGFVLLIACVNVANLLLARAHARSREFAVRSALGASRVRIVRQLLTESVLLAVFGAAGGLLLASWGTSAAVGLIPKTLPNAPRLDTIHLDARVLLFTLATCVFAGLLFGLVPALRGARSDVNATLKENVRGSSAIHQRARSVLVVVEMALALVLLVGAGLMLRTLMSLWRVDPGFDPHHVIWSAINLPQPAQGPALPPDAGATLIRRMHQQIASVPGIEAASLSSGATPMSGDDEVQFWIAGEPKPATDSEMRWGLDYIVEPDYFRAMRIQLLRGRLLSDQDNERAPLVAVVDEDFAHTFFPNKDPLGARINSNAYGMGIEIVGIVRHVNQWGLGFNPAKFPLQAQVYFPILQLPAARRAAVAKGAVLIARTSLPPAVFNDAVRHALSLINNQAIVFQVLPMEEIIGQSLATRRFAMLLLAIFAALALLLAAIGIYGVISYAVGQRTREIGIRMALGAQRRDVLRIVLGQGARLAGIGLLAGVIAALGLSRLLESVLWGVRPTDPLTYAAVCIVLAAVALLACFLPARRAVRVDPTVALRYE